MDQCSIYLLAAIVFLLPVYQKALPPLIGLWVMFSVARIIRQKRKLTFNRSYVLLLAFYLLLVCGCFWSMNTKSAGFDLEVKMSFAIFPIIFSFLNYSKSEIRIILKGFILGLILMGIFLIRLSLDLFVKEPHLDYFFYDYLSRWIHPSYMSMYYVLGLAFLLIDFRYKTLNLLDSKIQYLGLISFYFLFNILLLSRIGIIIGALILGYFMIGWLVKSKRYMLGITIVLGFLVLGYTGYKTIPYVTQRVDELVEGFTSSSTDSESNGSSGIRLKIWEQGIELVKERPLLGYGTGDVKDELVKKYFEHSIDVAYKNKLNAHNQFLQVTISVGIIGLILFLSILFSSIQIGYKFNNPYIRLFIFMIIIYMLTESVLENQAGTIFFGLFFTFLNQKAFWGIGKN